MFTSSTKREIKQFHVVVVQRRQRNEQKDVIHVQRCCFANLTLLPFCRPRCRRRRCCLSFLIIRTERFWFNISRRKVFFFFPRSQRFLISIFVVVVVIVLFLLVMEHKLKPRRWTIFTVVGLVPYPSVNVRLRLTLF